MFIFLLLICSFILKSDIPKQEQIGHKSFARHISNVVLLNHHNNPIRFAIINPCLQMAKLTVGMGKEVKESQRKPALGF